ncbi:MAG: phosphatidylglycerophosphatase A [Desulfovibrio sp.]|jgi:phosphatidylglycerophosphatase A|nr:phosphatidylglycerophosphatase A [Desulfovibrio sp.]
MRDRLILCYARVAFAGKSPVMPGTCGSLAALLTAPYLFVPLPVAGRLLFLALILASGIWASGRAEKLLRRVDPPEVVIDEFFGQWLALLPFAAPSFAEYAAAFILFRFFDITKLRPVKDLEAVAGGAGIMLDDAAAGLYAALCLGLLRMLF